MEDKAGVMTLLQELVVLMVLLLTGVVMEEVEQ